MVLPFLFGPGEPARIESEQYDRAVKYAVARAAITIMAIDFFANEAGGLICFICSG